MLRWQDCDQDAVRWLLDQYELNLTETEQESIPGSFWGEEEAGLIGSHLYVRDDTPLHSILHEACHYVCMDAKRRDGLDTNAGGDYDEENAVCFLQILLADFIPGFDQELAFADMDAWGYSFRFGSSRAWFEQDAEDAREWLLKHRIIDVENLPTWQLRDNELVG